MFNLLSVLLYIVNSIFSAIYTSKFLKTKQNKKASFILWIVLYFTAQFVIFELIESIYPFNDLVGVVINLLLLAGLQWIFFSKNLSAQLFVCFSFVAGKEIVKYIVSVLSVVLGKCINSWIDVLIEQGKIVTKSQAEIINIVTICATSFATIIVYALIFGAYLFFINKKYVRKEYQLQTRENVFLILPSVASICISITIKMMILSVENGTTKLIFDTVSATMFWVPVICILLLGLNVANVMLFQNVVQYHEENRKRTLLENQIEQMRKEVQEIQDIYSDMRGLRHDLRGHINNITQYVKRYDNADTDELNGYIKNMEETVDKLDFSYRTKNPITDIIIHQKSQEAEKAGIKFSVDFIYPKELQIDVYDIGIILNNALENAIEATSYVETDKYISLHSYVKGNLFFIEIENNFARDIIFNKESGLPNSSKANKKLHGMGLANIQRCARKYKGDIDIVVSEHKIFNLTVMLNGK